MSVNLVSFASGNGLSPVRCQAITWTSADLLSIGPTLGNKFKWNSNENRKLFIHENTFENVICKIAAILILNVSLVRKRRCYRFDFATPLHTTASVATVYSVLWISDHGLGFCLIGATIAIAATTLDVCTHSTNHNFLQSLSNFTCTYLQKKAGLSLNILQIDITVMVQYKMIMHTAL